MIKVCEEKLNIEDLQIGMQVNKKQLSNILDTWILLVKPKSAKKEENSRICYIGKKLDNVDHSIYNSNYVITPIYNDSADLEGDICFDD